MSHASMHILYGFTERLNAAMLRVWEFLWRE